MLYHNGYSIIKFIFLKDRVQVQIKDEITETTLRIIRWELHRYHETYPIILERECMMDCCSFIQAFRIIKNRAVVVNYVLNL